MAAGGGCRYAGGWERMPRADSQESRWRVLRPGRCLGACRAIRLTSDSPTGSVRLLVTDGPGRSAAAVRLRAAPLNTPGTRWLSLPVPNRLSEAKSLPVMLSSVILLLLSPPPVPPLPSPPIFLLAQALRSKHTVKTAARTVATLGFIVG
jgi:hypothetical protein